MRASLTLLIAWCLVGCGENDPLGPTLEADFLEPPSPAEPIRPLDPQDVLTLEDRINAAVANIASDTCFAGPDTSMCEWRTYGLAGHFNMAASTGEAILVIDDFGEGALPQLVRYRNRLLGVYRVDTESETIVERGEAVRLPKQLGDALVSFAGPDFIPASRLLRVAVAAGTTYGRLPLLFLGHGGIVFSHLVELAPEQPVVLLNLTGLFGLLPSLCGGVNEGSLAAAAAHYANIADSLSELMHRHNVRFVNASFGDSAQTLAADWSRTCGDPVPSAPVLRRVLHLYDPVYDVLFNTPGVVTAHAAANLGAPADFPFDQVSPLYPNRVRVGFISSKSSGLDPLGRGTVRKAEQQPRNNSDADVFVNWNCEVFRGCADRHYELAGSFGLGATSLPIMATSYVNPLGLGRLINLRYADHGDEPQVTDELIEVLKQELVPPLCGAAGDRPCVYQDPILHRQLEVYRYIP